MKSMVNTGNKVNPYTLIVTLFLFLLAVFAIRIGWRDISIGTDYSRYHRWFLQVLDNTYPWGHFEPGYELLNFLGGAMGLSPEIFFAFVAFFQMIMMAWAFKEISFILLPHRVSRYTILFVGLAVLLLWPFTLSVLTNAIRQGLAIPFLLLGMAFLLKKQYPRAGLAFVLATMFHMTSFVFILPCVLFARFRRPMMMVLTSAILIYVFQLTGVLMMYAEMLTHIPVYTRVLEYGASSSYNAGYRYDFLMFSIAPIVLMLIIRLSVRKNLMFVTAIDTLIAIHGALIIPFLLLGYGAYSNRWLLPAWLLMPLFPALVVAFFARRTPGLSLFGGVFLILTALLTLLVRPVPLL